MASAAVVFRRAPMPVIMPVADSNATASVGQRRVMSMESALPRSISRNSRKTAVPEKMPRQNSMVISPASMLRTNRADDDQARAAPATSRRPIWCCLCSALVMTGRQGSCFWQGGALTIRT